MDKSLKRMYYQIAVIGGVICGIGITALNWLDGAAPFNWGTILGAFVGIVGGLLLMLGILWLIFFVMGKLSNLD